VKCYNDISACLRIVSVCVKKYQQAASGLSPCGEEYRVLKPSTLALKQLHIPLVKFILYFGYVQQQLSKHASQTIGNKDIW
jgi:hypothetical protein